VPGPGSKLVRPVNHQSSTFSDKRVKGIEPSCPAWEAGVLPLNYTRIGKEEMVMGER
jgi:hypothetical protein